MNRKYASNDIGNCLDLFTILELDDPDAPKQSQCKIVVIFRLLLLTPCLSCTDLTSFCLAEDIPNTRLPTDYRGGGSWTAAHHRLKSTLEQAFCCLTVRDRAQ